MINLRLTRLSWQVRAGQERLYCTCLAYGSAFGGCGTDLDLTNPMEHSS
jgi:hypothetical protein